MTQQLKLFDVADLPPAPAAVRQPCVVFTGYGDNTGRQCRIVLPSEKAIAGHLTYIESLQRTDGVTPDVRVQWRTVTCGEWGDA